MNFSDNTTQIILAIIGLIAAGFTIRFVIKRNSKNNSNKNKGDNNNNTIIKNNTTTGDIAGRDINKK